MKLLSVKINIHWLLNFIPWKYQRGCPSLINSEWIWRIEWLKKKMPKRLRLLWKTTLSGSSRTQVSVLSFWTHLVSFIFVGPCLETKKYVVSQKLQIWVETGSSVTGPQSWRYRNLGEGTHQPEEPQGHRVLLITGFNFFQFHRDTGLCCTVVGHGGDYLQSIPFNNERTVKQMQWDKPKQWKQEVVLPWLVLKWTKASSRPLYKHYLNNSFP